MQLPGGLVEDGKRQRDWAFRPVSGALELAVAEAGEGADGTPQAVTRALTLALEHLAGEAPTASRVGALCVADRQFLMRELDRHLGFAGGWFQVDCVGCGAPFDFRLDYADLPVQEAGEGYPVAQVDMDGRRLHFRLPGGADQETLAGLPEAQARLWLLRQLAQEPDQLGEPDDALIAAVETALEAISPGVVLRLQSACPECGAANEAELDPYRVLSRRSEALLQEVHQIAMHYHWRETDILDLPRPRRQQYLQMIDRARGLAV
jgi:hypothetical protein